MEKWEVDKINDLYKELDVLRNENKRLKENATDAAIARLETKVDMCMEVLLKANTVSKMKRK